MLDKFVFITLKKIFTLTKVIMQGNFDNSHNSFL